MIDTLVFLSNGLSARLAEATLEQDGVQLSRTAVFTSRPFRLPWLDGVADFHGYPALPSNRFVGQMRFLPYYVTAARAMRRYLSTGQVQRIFITNNDNLLTSHVLSWANMHPHTKVTVICEGMMNFQDIQLRNRAPWRHNTKRLVSRVLGLHYDEPKGHLSGAFDPSTHRVVSFADVGLHAPPDKVEVVRFRPVQPQVRPDPKAGLFAASGIWKYLEPQDRIAFADRFAAWVREQDFAKLYVRRHPHYDASIVEERLPPFDLWQSPRGSLEDVAAHIPAQTVFATHCTALATLSMLRPDLNRIDFGADYYCERAYYGDRSVVSLLQALDVRMVASAPYATHHADSRHSMPVASVASTLNGRIRGD